MEGRRPSERPSRSIPGSSCRCWPEPGLPLSPGSPAATKRRTVSHQDCQNVRMGLWGKSRCLPTSRIGSGDTFRRWTMRRSAVRGKKLEAGLTVNLERMKAPAPTPTPITVRKLRGDRIIVYHSWKSKIKSKLNMEKKKEVLFCIEDFLRLLSGLGETNIFCVEWRLN